MTLKPPQTSGDLMKPSLILPFSGSPSTAENRFQKKKKREEFLL
jgi:hypothetical protein